MIDRKTRAHILLVYRRECERRQKERLEEVRAVAKTSPELARLLFLATPALHDDDGSLTHPPMPA